MDIYLHKSILLEYRLEDNTSANKIEVWDRTTPMDYNISHTLCSMCRKVALRQDNISFPGVVEYTNAIDL